MEDQIFWIIISIIVFLFIREVVCWYWKINEITYLLEEIRDLLKPPKDDDDDDAKMPEEESTPIMFGFE